MSQPVVLKTQHPLFVRSATCATPESPPPSPTDIHRDLPSAAIAMASAGTGQQQQLVSQLKRSMAANLKNVTGMCESDLELQQLLIGTAENYVAEKQKLAETGTSLLEASRAKRRKGGRAEADAADDDAPVSIPPGIMLRRGLRVFRGWGNKLALELLCFLEPCVKQKIRDFQKDELHRLIEYSLDVRLFGVTLDRIGVDNKADLFQKLMSSYETLGRRMRALDFDKNGVDWARFGHFEVTEGPVGVQVLCKILKQRIIVS